MRASPIALPARQAFGRAVTPFVFGLGLWAGPAPASDEGFRAALAALRPEAIGQGVPAALFDDTVAGLSPDPTIAALTRAQPGEVKPLGAYLASQVTPARIAMGRTMLARWRPDLDAIERRFRVPPAIVVAIWGLESAYGSSAGGRDVIRSLATLVGLRYRPALYRAELIAALAMLRDGDVPRERLRGSWAGAMGLPQFLPSSFQRYAVDFDGDGRRDIWTNVPDALASIASFLHEQGWRAEASWGVPVRVPSGTDLARSRAPFADWADAGFGPGLPNEGEGVLYFPAGAAGPAFLVTPNFEVLKTYNFSDAYALSVGFLADAIAGRAPVLAGWPRDPPISRTDRIALQARLAGQGYAVDNREGRISLALRDTIRRAQVDLGLVADGNPTPALLHALETKSAR